MKQRRSFGMMAAGIAMAIAGSLGTAQVGHTAQSTPASQQRASEMKSTVPTKSTPKKRVVQHSGGLDIVQEGAYHSDYGMTPMEYGMRYGNGKSGKGKTNMLRVKHNYKVKKR